MVDALKRVHRMLRRGGTLLDIHPTSAAAAVQVDDEVLGHVETANAPARHAAASAAIGSVVGGRLFIVARALEFEFFTYGDSADELRDYVQENWRDARIGDAVIARVRRALEAARGSRPRVREIVHAAALVAQHAG
jgi:hypothetical protein